MLLAEDDLAGDPEDAVRRDPEVRQARRIADAARSRLLKCVAEPREVVDMTEAQRMLDVLRQAQEFAADAEDRVLVHRGLLTPAEAERRAATRRLADRAAVSAVAAVGGAGPAGMAGHLPAVPPAARRAARAAAHALIPMAAGFAGAAIARRR